MNVVDFNVHLPPEPRSDLDLDLRTFDAPSSLRRLAPALTAVGVRAANVMVLDPDLLRRDARPLFSTARDLGLHVTLMIDPRTEDALDLVDEATRLGVNGIKLHPYFLGLEERDTGAVVRLAKHVEARGLWMVICNSYGTKALYRVRPTHLLAAICEAVTRVPIVSLHAGGAKVIDAMSIALDCPNLLLETSFSLPFWVGSSVETDFVFAMRKLGLDRWVYGSDHPYVDAGASLDAMRAFAARHRFSDQELEQLLARTAIERLGVTA